MMAQGSGLILIRGADAYRLLSGGMLPVSAGYQTTRVPSESGDVAIFMRRHTQAGMDIFLGKRLFVILVTVLQISAIAIYTTSFWPCLWHRCSQAHTLTFSTGHQLVGGAAPKPLSSP